MVPLLLQYLLPRRILVFIWPRMRCHSVATLIDAHDSACLFLNGLSFVAYFEQHV